MTNGRCRSAGPSGRCRGPVLLVLEQRDHVEAGERSYGGDAPRRTERGAPGGARPARWTGGRMRSARVMVSVALLMPASSPGSTSSSSAGQALTLGPPQVHPKEHLGPVLRVDPARARRGARPPRRCRRTRPTGGSPAPPGPVPLEGTELPGQLGRQLGIVLFGQELVGGAQIVNLLHQFGVAAEDPLMRESSVVSFWPRAESSHTPGSESCTLQLARARRSGVDVKGTPSRCPPVGSGRRCGRCIRS